MQYGLFDRGPPKYSFARCRRTELGVSKQGIPAWIDHCPGFLAGHLAVFDELQGGAAWRRERRQMYDREVEVPRCLAALPEEGAGAQILVGLAAVLGQRYGRALASVSLAYYRGGKDSVAPHGDKMGPLIPDTVIAVLSLGAARRFTLTPKQPSAESAGRVFFLGEGDLVVMGGSCQETHLHGVPKVASAAPRISVQYREQLSLAAQASATRRFGLPSGPLAALGSPPSALSGRTG